MNVKDLKEAVHTLNTDKVMHARHVIKMEMAPGTYREGLFLRQGQLRPFGIVVLCLLGVGLIWGSIGLVDSRFLVLCGICVGIVAIGVGGVAARAQAIGLRPFTTDPLGWRRAKATYAEKRKDDSLG